MWRHSANVWLCGADCVAWGYTGSFYLSVSPLSLPTSRLCSLLNALQSLSLPRSLPPLLSCNSPLTAHHIFLNINKFGQQLSCQMSCHHLKNVVLPADWQWLSLLCTRYCRSLNCVAEPSTAAEKDFLDHSICSVWALYSTLGHRVKSFV